MTNASLYNQAHISLIVYGKESKVWLPIFSKLVIFFPRKSSVINISENEKTPMELDLSHFYIGDKDYIFKP